MSQALFSTSKAVAALPSRRWWLSLYPRFSSKGKRGLVLICLGVAMLAPSISLRNSTAHSQTTYDNPAVQNALRRLSLPSDPVGNQFQINSFTLSEQSYPAVAMDSDGDFVVVWVSDGGFGNDTSVRSIQGQRYNSVGVPQGSQFQVNSYTTGAQSSPAIALDNDGDFIVVWASYGADNDTDDFSIQGQRYNSAGAPQGGQFQVNTYTPGWQNRPSVAADSDGDFIVVWVSVGSDNAESIQAQRYNSVGEAQGSQFQVNSYSTTGRQEHPRVASDSEGDFVVVWESLGSNGNDTDTLSVQGQRYNSAGVPQGSQFQVNSYTTDDQPAPTVAMDSEGDFVVIWNSKAASSGDISSIQGQRFNAVGIPQGSQFQVNSYTSGQQGSRSIAMDSAGDFVVVWESFGSSGSDDDGFSIQGQEYDRDGTAQGDQFQVNSYTSYFQSATAVAMDADGDFVVVWESNGSNYGDTDNHSIQGQRFDVKNAVMTEFLYLPAVITNSPPP